jgi:hypothetical protein
MDVGSFSGSFFRWTLSLARSPLPLTLLKLPFRWLFIVFPEYRGEQHIQFASNDVEDTGSEVDSKEKLQDRAVLAEVPGEEREKSSPG